MSWQLGSMALVLGALGGGFAWYERSRPSSKLIALVATLAAIAVAGRIVFAAIPNVQATTDVVLLSGYALGAGPGFAVGAVGALASNFFLGQGPWTPWQMLGWGAIGAGGAALARITDRDLLTSPARLSLTVACVIAGLAFGAWMDLFTLMTFAAERSFHAYLAISATSLPFNVAHAVGNAVLCLLFGPGFLRLLVRYRARFHVDWRPLTSGGRGVGVRTAALPALVLVAVSLMPSTERARADAARGAVRYLERVQNTDGGFGGGAGQRSSALMTGWAVIGLEAAGRDPLDVRRGRRTPIDYLRAHSGELRETGDVERTLLALGGAGLSGRRFGGHSLVGLLASRQRPDGSFEGQVNLTSFAILALRAAGRHVRANAIRSAARWLAGEQSVDGGFSFSRRGGASDVDDTGAALQALAAARSNRPKLRSKALAYLRRGQNLEGGFGQLSGSRSNAQSTAWGIQALVAVGKDPDRFRRHGGRSPLAYLGSLQQADGSFRYSRTSAQTPVWVTAQAIAAVRRKPFPFTRLRRRSSRRHTGARTIATAVAGSAARRPHRRRQGRRHPGRALVARSKLDVENAALAGHAVRGPATRADDRGISPAVWIASAAGAAVLVGLLAGGSRRIQKRARRRV